MSRTIFIVVIICLLSIQDMNCQEKKSIITEKVKIGLLVGNNTYDEARFGAEMAIQEANEKGGVDGRTFQLVTRSLEGPWGTGSKEAVNLVFEEKVWAIMGSHKGRNAHLVEQVITKTRVVFLAAWSTDPTLSQAFVPWYFSCIPNDNQQATALAEEIYTKRNITKIAVVSDSSYDAKMALNSFLKASESIGTMAPLQLFCDNSMGDFNVLLDKIHKAKIEGIVLLGNPAASLRFIQQLRQKKMNQPVFGTLSLLGEAKLDNVELADYSNFATVTSVNWQGSKEMNFTKEFQKKYSKIPGVVAAYAYDGMNIIIDAIKNTRLDREKVQEAMSKTRYKGITGFIQFDERGNRMGAVDLLEIKNGIP